MNNNDFKFKALYSNGHKSEILHESYPGHAFKWLEEGQPVTIFQYSGLNDKNEDEIFNSDVLKDDEGHLWFVEFSEGAFRIYSYDIQHRMLLCEMNKYLTLLTFEERTQNKDRLNYYLERTEKGNRNESKTDGN